MALFRTMLSDILEKGGYEIAGQAVNGAEALGLTIILKPDIVILDVVMPLSNGIEVAKEISRLSMPPKIVVCTSLNNKPVVEEAIRAGVNAYIIKPFEEEKVLLTLKGL
jgi:two-component system chemotaxis response regulator CheY